MEDQKTMGLNGRHPYSGMHPAFREKPFEIDPEERRPTEFGK
jgi:hypothetical protein